MKLYWKIKITFILVFIMMSSCCSTIEGSTMSSTVSQETIIPTVRPTITLMSSLSAEEAEVKVIELLIDNGGCRLPCFWGLVPGQTYEDKIISFLHQFSEISPGVEITITRDYLHLETLLTFGGIKDPQNEIIEWINVDMTAFRRLELLDGYQDINIYDPPFYMEYFPYYHISNLLSIYGSPENVYTFYENEMYTNTFYLYLDYTSSGWVALLNMPMKYKGKNNEIIESCPSQAMTSLRLWSPDDVVVAREFGFADYDGPLKSIEKTHSISIEEFYNKYKNPANTECLEAPIYSYER